MIDDTKYRVVRDGNGFYRVQKCHWSDVECRPTFKQVEEALDYMSDLILKRDYEENYNKIDRIIEIEE